MPVTETSSTAPSDAAKELWTLSLVQPVDGLTVEEALERNRKLVESLPGLTPAARLALFMALYERGC